MKDNEKINDFLGRNLDPLVNPDFGSQNFKDILVIFSELRDLITEMINIGVNISLPRGIEERIIYFASQWNSHHNNIRKYNFVEDARNGFAQRQQILNSVISWHNSCLIGADPQQSNNPNNFFSIYSTVKSLANKDIEGDRIRLNELIADFERKKKDVDEITNELRKKSSEETISDYAQIFRSAADGHSSFGLKGGIKLGSAEKWLTLGIVMIIVFALTINKLNDWLGISYTTSEPGLLTIQIISRLLVISIWVYVISFCLKQYSVNKHLATLNRHRQNTLNSYKLFLQSIDPTDGITKNALMMEVAKSIYEHGNTGHLSSKASDNSPSIIELTRFINQTSK